MLVKSSKTPQGRLLSLFDILNDWLNAPNIQKKLQFEDTANLLLIAFLTEQAKMLGAENPSMLAQYILLVAQKAMQQAIDEPNSNSFAHAKKAVQALILAQTQRTWRNSSLIKSKPVIYSVAASFLLLIGTSAIWLPTLLSTKFKQPELAQNIQVRATPSATILPHKKQLTAYDATQMYAKYEQMRQGTCQFPEALQIPDQHKAVYLNNVVGGELPATLADLEITNFYLGKVRCNFTPMLMANSK